MNEYEEKLLEKRHESEFVQDKGIFEELWDTILAMLPRHTLPPSLHIIEIPEIGALQYERATKDWLYNSSKFSTEAYLYVDKRKLEKLFHSGNIALLPDEFLENVAKGQDFGNYIKVPMVCEQRTWHRRSDKQANEKRVPTFARVRFGFPGVQYNEKHKHFIHTYFKNETMYNAGDLIGVTVGNFKGRNDGLGFRQFKNVDAVKIENCGFGRFVKGEKQKGLKVFSESKHETGKNFYCNETYYTDQNDPESRIGKIGRRVRYNQLRPNFTLQSAGGADNEIKGDKLFKTEDGKDFTIKTLEGNRVITKTIPDNIDLAQIDINVPKSIGAAPQQVIVFGGGVVEEYFDISVDQKIVIKEDDNTGKKYFYHMSVDNNNGNKLSQPAGTASVIQEQDPTDHHLTYCDFLFGDKFIRLKVGKKANPAAGGTPSELPREYADVKKELNKVAQALYSGDMDYFAKIKKDTNGKNVFEEVEIKFPDRNEIKIDLKGPQPTKQFSRNGSPLGVPSPVGESKSFYDDFNTKREVWNTTNITLDDLESMTLEVE